VLREFVYSALLGLVLMVSEAVFLFLVRLAFYGMDEYQSQVEIPFALPPTPSLSINVLMSMKLQKHSFFFSIAIITNTT